MFCSTLAQNSQLKSKLVNSFLSRLSKTMLPLSPKPGQDHPKAQQQRKLTSTSPKSKPRSQIFAIKKETHFKFLAAFINYGGAFNKHGKSIPGPPQRCLKNSDSIFFAYLFLLSYRICRGCPILKKKNFESPQRKGQPT